jgi:1-acyl-sn-glycerol-3-phosphate acyltransferase
LDAARRPLLVPATTDRSPAQRSGLIGAPSYRANLGYRLARRIARLLAWRLFRIHVEGLENLPRDESGAMAGGWICAGLPHQTWVEPAILLGLLPAEPRLAMMADAPTAVGSWWRRRLMSIVGGVVLIPRRAASGTRGFEHQVAAVAKVLDAGAVFSIFPEQGPPTRPPALRRVSPAVAYFALRTGRPIVPVVFGGTHELFLRRSIVVRILPAQPTPPATPAGSASGREAAERLLGELLARVVPVADEVHRAAEPRPGAHRRWRWLTGPYPRVADERD